MMMTYFCRSSPPPSLAFYGLRRRLRRTFKASHEIAGEKRREELGTGFLSFSCCLAPVRFSLPLLFSVSEATSHFSGGRREKKIISPLGSNHPKGVRANVRCVYCCPRAQNIPAAPISLSISFLPFCYTLNSLLFLLICPPSVPCLSKKPI